MAAKAWLQPAPTYLPLDSVWDSDEDAPGPRCAHSLTAVAATKSNGPRLILFGGATAIEGGASSSNPGIRLAGVTNSVHSYDVQTQKWTRIRPAGDPPSPRAAHAAAAVGTMVVFQVNLQTIKFVVLSIVFFGDFAALLILHWLSVVTMRAYSPLAMGILSGKYLAGDGGPTDARLNIFKGRYSEGESRYNLSNVAIKAATKEYLRIAEKYGLQPSTLAIAFVLQHPLVASAVFGATKLCQLQQVLDGCHIKLSPEIMAEINKVHYLDVKTSRGGSLSCRVGTFDEKVQPKPLCRAEHNCQSVFFYL